MRRAIVLAVLLTALVAAGVPETSASPGYESDFLARIDSERSSRGLPSLSSDPRLVDVARRHSERMASDGRLYHNQNLRNEVDGWVALGENVGRGPDTASIHDAFMASPGHRAQILDADYKEIGIGVVERNGELWVTEVFVLRSESTAAAATATPTASNPATSRTAGRSRTAVLARSAPAPEPPPAPAPVEPADPHFALADYGSMRDRPVAMAIPPLDMPVRPLPAAWAAAALLLLVACAHLAGFARRLQALRPPRMLAIGRAGGAPLESIAWRSISTVRMHCYLR